MLLTMLSAAGCGGDPTETTPSSESTPVATPEESTPAATPEESTPVATPEESTPEPLTYYSISYDLGGGIDGGNPTVYNGEESLKLIIPIRPGYDFVGWTGTGIETPTVSVNIPQGSSGDLTFTAHWVENTDFEVIIDKTTKDILGQTYYQLVKFILVKSDTANDVNEQVARDLQAFFDENKTIVKITTDSALEKSTAKYDFKFFFGKSRHESVSDFTSEIGYGEYGVYATADSLCFMCWDESSYEAACAIYYEIFDHVFKGGSFLDFEGGKYVGAAETTLDSDAPIPEKFDSITDVGEGAVQFYSLDSTMEEFEAYCARVADAGFALHTTNVMNKTHCATYYNDKYIVNVVFAGGDAEGVLGETADRSLRIVIEPTAGTALPMLEKETATEEAATPIKLVMLDNNSDHSVDKFSREGNLCLIIQLSNGHFIVIDSNNNACAKSVNDYLRGMAPDGKPIVDAWILTHFHEDHIGGFVTLCNSSSMLRYTTVKSVIYAFPSDRVLDTPGDVLQHMDLPRTFYSVTKPKLTEKGTTFYRARTGQKYYFGDAEIEILWTFEDIAPHNIFLKDRSNPTCMGFTVTIAGQKLMITGDSSTEELKVAAIRYGDYLKSDLVQLSHHGYGDGNVGHDFYKYVNSPYAICSGIDYAYGDGEKWAKNNAEVFIVREKYGTCVIPLPYDGGKFESAIKP